MPRTRQEPLGCLTTLLRLFGINIGPRGAEELPYRLRDDFLSPAERSFYRVLVAVVGSEAVVCPKVNLADSLQRAAGRSAVLRLPKLSPVQRNKGLLRCLNWGTQASHLRTVAVVASNPQKQ